MKKMVKIIFVFLLFGGLINQNIYAQEINIFVNKDQKEAYSPWLMYGIDIAGAMQRYYKEHPDGKYVISFDDELQARNTMINSYLMLKNNQQIENEYLYIEEMILIKNAGYFEEYIYFSFNPGTWMNEKDLIEDNYINWKNINIPNHNAITLVFVKEK